MKLLISADHAQTPNGRCDMGDKHNVGRSPILSTEIEVDAYCNEGSHWVDQRDIDKASGWCKIHAPQNALKCVIVCASCGRMKISDHRHRKTCSVCREKAAGRPRHRCPLCGRTKRRRAVVCSDCARYLPMMQRNTHKAAEVAAMLGWSKIQQKRWALAKTREQLRGDVWAGSSTDSHN